MLRTLRVRLKLARIGVFSFRRFRYVQFRSLRIAGKRVRIKVLPEEENTFKEMLIDIYMRDDYGIEAIDPRPKEILDIGANVGCFAMVAKHLYPEARIHAYEPNPALAPILENNLTGLGIHYFAEAVGGRSGKVDFSSVASGCSLCGKVRSSQNGNVPMVGIATAIERLGGAVDLLKLDCEGSEWEILSETAALERISHIRMEYHLWGNPKPSLERLERILTSQGFTITRQLPCLQANGEQGLVWADRPR